MDELMKSLGEGKAVNRASMSFSYRWIEEKLADVAEDYRRRDTRLCTVFT